MSDDPLKAATRALREETAEAEASAKFTRARVMASLHQSQVRRRTRLAFLLPIAACFAAASAFGMAGGRAPTLIQSIARVFGVETPSAPPAPAKTAAKPPSRPSARSQPVQREPASVAVPPAPTKAEPEPQVAPPAPLASAKREHDPAHDLYRAAHRAHFSEHDYATALSGWEAYLAKAPRGRFAIEAEYNRALCLARLGRSEAARDALTPFAEGKRGGYRQSDARPLLDALGR